MGGSNGFNGWDLAELEDMDSFIKKYNLKDQDGQFKMDKLTQMYGTNVKLF